MEQYYEMLDEKILRACEMVDTTKKSDFERIKNLDELLADIAEGYRGIEYYNEEMERLGFLLLEKIEKQNLSMFLVNYQEVTEKIFQNEDNSVCYGD